LILDSSTVVTELISILALLATNNITPAADPRQSDRFILPPIYSVIYLTSRKPAGRQRSI